MTVFTSPYSVCVMIMTITIFVTPGADVRIATTQPGLVNTGTVVSIMVVNYIYTGFCIDTGIVTEITTASLTIASRYRCHQ